MAALVDECLFIADDVGIFDGGKNSDFVKGILFVFLLEFLDVDSLESVEALVVQSLHLVDLAVGPLACTVTLAAYLVSPELRSRTVTLCSI